VPAQMSQNKLPEREELTYSSHVDLLFTARAITLKIACCMKANGYPAQLYYTSVESSP
jgi:hypothetical protein